MNGIHLFAAASFIAAGVSVNASASPLRVETGRGAVSFSMSAAGGLRVTRGEAESPEFVFVDGFSAQLKREEMNGVVSVSGGGLVANVDKKTGLVTFVSGGKAILSEKEVFGKGVAFDSPEGERLYGLGQFQDGALNIRNLPRRLVQVNTQASVPFMVSTRGWGLHWHSYARVDFNPCTQLVKLEREGGAAEGRSVDVTTNAGNAKEERAEVALVGTFDVPEEGEYAFDLDSGEKMSRQQVVDIDGKRIVSNRNVWLPPTVGFRLRLAKGRHAVRVLADSRDAPTLGIRPDRGESRFVSDFARGTDYVVYPFEPAKAVAAFRRDCGGTAALPDWAWGYWHCQERFATQQELLDALHYFKKNDLPLSVLVQDWFWWLDDTWNSMEWSKARYPNPKAMMDECHDAGVRVMLSVWPKATGECRFTKEVEAINGFIPGTSWIDYSKKESVDLFWKWVERNLASVGIDAWWLDAVEPENDDLHGRTWTLGSGDEFRNVYPLLVNLAADRKQREMGREPLVLTRCAFAGQCRTASVVWSGDVGSEWKDLRTQVLAGLGASMAGVPYWTTDGGGFFRPSDQYTNADFQKRFVRWVQWATFCPIQRVHGHKTDNTFSRFGAETERLLSEQVRLRERIRPYVKAAADEAVRANAPMMVPLFDAPAGFETEYMFGRELLVCPVTADVEEMDVYLPAGAWEDFFTGERIEGGRVLRVATPIDRIPVFRRVGARLVSGQLDANAVSGAAIARGGDAVGVRLAPLLPEWGRQDRRMLERHLYRKGPYAPDGSYGRTEFIVPTDPKAIRDMLAWEAYSENATFVPDYPMGQAAKVSAEWVLDNGALHVRYSTDRDVDALLYVYGALGSLDATPALRDGAVFAKKGALEVAVKFPEGTDAFFTGPHDDAVETAARGLFAGGGGNVGAVRVALKAGVPFDVVLSQMPCCVDKARVDGLLAAARKAAEAEMMTSSGAAEGCADAVSRTVGFFSAYNHERDRRYVAVNRDWCGDGSKPPNFMWDDFFDAYLTACANPELAKESLQNTLDIIRERGLAGAPPQRNLIIPVLYSKLVRLCGDDAYAAETYPVMMDFVRFWFADRGDGQAHRDGNGDGLIESGTFLKPGEREYSAHVVSSALDETGYDDSPMYCAGFAQNRVAMLADGVKFDFAKGTLNLDLVGQNSLYVAACRAMALVADRLGKDGDAKWLRGEADRVAGRIKDHLYDPEQGFYNNRFWDGAFSKVRTPTIFYPLMTGIADAKTAENLRGVLTDPKEFWGGNLIPTVSWSDPSFSDFAKQSDSYWQGNYWRGNVWGPMNYIVYLSLVGTEWSDVRSEYARRNREQFMAEWTPWHRSCENYPPKGVTTRPHRFAGNGGRDDHYAWGAMLAQIPLEELFSVEEFDDSLRFGAVDAADFGSWKGFWYHGVRCSVECDADGVRLDVPGEFSLKSTKPMEFRRFRRGRGAFAADVLAPEGGEVEIASGGAVFRATARRGDRCVRVEWR